MAPRHLWFVSVVFVVIVSAVVGCGDDDVVMSNDSGVDSGSGSPDGGAPTDGATSVDGGADADGGAGADGGVGPDGGAVSAFDVCDAPGLIVDYTAPESVNRVVLASAPGSPLVAAWTDATSGLGSHGCAVSLFDGSVWSAASSREADCAPYFPRHAASGGGLAIVTHSDRLTGEGHASRTDGTTWTNLGATTATVWPDSQIVSLNATGDAIDAWQSAGGISAALFPHTAMTPTSLPENAVTGGIGNLTAAIDGDGNGVVLWESVSARTISARPFGAAAWRGAAVPLDEGGGVAELEATTLSTGDIYVVWNEATATNLVRGATVHVDSSGVASWSAIDEIRSGMGFSKLRVLSATDDELTVIWYESDGSGVPQLSARKRIGGTWGTTAMLGRATSQFNIAVIDTHDTVFVLRNPGDGTIHHHHIAHGSDTWLADVRVDAASGAGMASPLEGALAMEPSTGALVVAWAVASDAVYAICH